VWANGKEDYRVSFGEALREEFPGQSKIGWLAVELAVAVEERCKQLQIGKRGQTYQGTFHSFAREEAAKTRLPLDGCRADIPVES
jgi:hypothetical protein